MFVERKSKHVRRPSGTHTHSRSRAGKDWQPHINEMKREKKKISTGSGVFAELQSEASCFLEGSWH